MALTLANGKPEMSITSIFLTEKILLLRLSAKLID
jgi:hypothetical protein